MKSSTILTPTRIEGESTEYRYKRLTTQLLMNDFRFGKMAPGAGDSLPNSELVTTDGERINVRDYAEGRPLLLIFGSLTCPMTVSSDPSLKRLHSEFGDKVAFLTLYVREAHPGENYPQPESLEEKLEHARVLKGLDQIPWTVAADDIEGTLHRALDAKPNAAYLAGADGKIVFRALWAGDERGLRKAVESVARGNVPTKLQSRSMLVPLLKGLGHFHEVFARAGRGAWRDVLLAALLSLGALAAAAIGIVLWWW